MTKSTDKRQWGKFIGGDASETGSGPGSYDIRKSVWHVNVSSHSTETTWIDADYGTSVATPN